MKKMNKKKGFTIVELVIVIAVIGILAAILIPTFVNLTSQANRVSNESFVKNINTQLALDGAQGKKSEAPSDALAKAQKIGFHVDDITPYDGNDIVWDETNDRYAILKADFPEHRDMDHVVFADASFNPATPLYKLWKFYDGMPSAQTYSIIAKKSWNVANVANLEVGFDIAEAAAPETVSYIGDQSETPVARNVILRTNSASTALSIEAATDVVRHYGSAGSVDIKTVAPESYHENGSVAFLEIANGRVALEKGAEVARIHLNATGIGSAAHFNGITVAKAPEVELPTFSRDAVEIPAEGKLVVALQESTETSAAKNYVWLTAVGVYEQVTVSESKTSAGSIYAAESGTETQKAAATQIANNITFSAAGEEYKVVATKSGDDWTYAVIDDEGQATEYTAAVEGGEIVVKDSEHEAVETKNENVLTPAEKQETKEEVVETAQNAEEVEKAEESGFIVTHHDALAPTCTEDGHTAYDSYDKNGEEIKIGYKVIEALGHDVDLETGICKRCNAQVYVAKVGETGYAEFGEAWSAAKNNTLVLLSDITLNALQISGAYTIDLNGHKMVLRGHSNAGTTGGAIYIDGGGEWTHGNLTIRNGELNMPGTNFSTYGIYNYGTLSLEDVTVNSACETAIYVNGQAWGSAGTTTLNNVVINATHASGTAFAAYALKNRAGTISPCVSIQGSEINAAYNAVMIYACAASISNTIITAPNNDGLWIMRAAMASGVTNTLTISGNVTVNGGSDYSRVHAQDGNTIVVDAGTYNFNPTSYVDTNSFDVAENDGVWTVTVKGE